MKKAEDGDLNGPAGVAAPGGVASRTPLDPAADPALRMGGIALTNGLILVSERNWAAAIREADGTISVASGKKPRLPGTGESEAADGAGAMRGAGGGRGIRSASQGGAAAMRGANAGRAGGGRGIRSASQGIPLLRGLGRFGESLLVLAVVKKRLPHAELPFEGGRVAAALAASLAGASAVRVAAPRSALVQEAGTALAAFIPAVLSVKNSAVSGYHGAEHKVIGAREEALRTAAKGSAVTAGDTAVLTGDAAAAAKEHDRCGSNLVGPYLFATVLTNLLARGRSGRKTPLSSAVAGAASLGIALEALRWAGRHGDSLLAKLLLAPGRALQKSLTTSEPTPEQLEVGERALQELLRLEGANA